MAAALRRTKNKNSFNTSSSLFAGRSFFSPLFRRLACGRRGVLFIYFFGSMTVVVHAPPHEANRLPFFVVRNGEFLWTHFNRRVFGCTRFTRFAWNAPITTVRQPWCEKSGRSEKTENPQRSSMTIRWSRFNRFEFKWQYEEATAFRSISMSKNKCELHANDKCYTIVWQSKQMMGDPWQFGHFFRILCTQSMAHSHNDNVTRGTPVLSYSSCRGGEREKSESKLTFRSYDKAIR